MGNANTTCTAEALDNYLLPSEAELEWPIAVQVIVHLLFLWWLLLGVGLASDEFMNSIEFITATKKTITDKKTGEKREVDVWNPTVANLSLMALGSSAPEILLSCVELFTSNMVVGPLGSFTIIGSASFNLFVISAVCTAGMPPGQTRLIKETGVFATTTCFSLIAYIWTVAIVSWWTPNLITIEEGLITFAMFPTMLIVAYRVDKAEMCAGPPAAPPALASLLPRLALATVCPAPFDRTGVSQPPTLAPLSHRPGLLPTSGPPPVHGAGRCLPGCREVSPLRRPRGSSARRRTGTARAPRSGPPRRAALLARPPPPPPLPPQPSPPLSPRLTPSPPPSQPLVLARRYGARRAP